MTSKFVKKTPSIMDVYNGDGPDCSYMSVWPEDADRVHIVIGARREDSCASSFSKEGVDELISILKDIRDALE